MKRVKFTLRLPPALAKRIRSIAGGNLNQFIVNHLERESMSAHPTEEPEYVEVVKGAAQYTAGRNTTGTFDVYMWPHATGHSVVVEHGKPSRASAQRAAIRLQKRENAAVLKEQRKQAR